MEKLRRIHIPPGLPLAGLILLLAGLLLQPIFRNISEDVLIKNTILNGIPFIMIFVAIILFYMSIIWIVASVLNRNIRHKLWKQIESAFIGGIVLGVFLMFQPWWFTGFRIGFHLLLASTLGFIFWSHVIPAVQRQNANPDPA